MEPRLHLLRELPFTAETYTYHVDEDSTIDSSTTVKDLGVLLSNDNSWTPHIRQMIIGARKVAAWVLSVFSLRTEVVMITLLKSLVRPPLEYCSPLWDPTKLEDIRDIENVQRYFTKRISSCSSLNSWDRLKKLKISSLQRRRERYIIIHTWKIANELAPNDIEMCFKYNKRLGYKAVVPALFKNAQRSVSTHYNNSFGVKAARLWNILPKYVNECTTFDSFKTALGSYLSNIPDTPPPLATQQ